MTRQPVTLAIEDLDVIAPGAFAAAVGPLFEGARGFLGRLAVARPFGSTDALFRAAREIAHAMPPDEQIELIDAHPRLGASPDTVSALSFDEQGYGTTATGRSSEADPVAAELARLNAAYEARFGFRYCVYVAGRSWAELLPEISASVGADRDVEIHRALDAVIDIARGRYGRLSA